MEKYCFGKSNNDNIFNKHIDKVTLLIKQDVSATMLQALRVVFRLRKGEQISEYDSKTSEFNFMSGSTKTICLTLLKDESYDELYEYLLNEFGKKLDIFANLKQLDITGREIIEFITLDNDPFKWYNNVNLFL